MAILINPAQDTAGGSFENALKTAKHLLDVMLKDFTDIELVRKAKKGTDGRFTFYYRHTLTGKIGEWNITGLEWEDEWKKQGYIFPPCMYWNGSSLGEPKLEDFLDDGYEVAIRKKEDVKL